MTDAELYQRGCQTLLASWDEYARGSTDAAVRRLPGVAVAVFPCEPERGVYNNALLEMGREPRQRAQALDAMEKAYADKAVTRFAAWAHESDRAMCDELRRRGYTVDTTTRAMGMRLDDRHMPTPQVDVQSASWPEYVRYEGLAPDFLRRAHHARLHVMAVRDGEEILAAALAYDFDGDCGIYNVGTVERARRRGLGTAVTLAQLRAAQERGCRTASLQSTPMAERLYANLGLRDLGRFREYVKANM
jgi:ribosomal protein S18 acetylase RimI-like enzyme